jgi:magnesium transporter
MDTGGNAGGQTIAIIIRGLAMKEFEPKECWKVLRRESMSALIIAGGVSLIGFIWFTLEQYLGIVTNPDLDGLVVNHRAFGLEWPLLESGFLQCAAMMVSLFVSLALFVAIFFSKIVAVLLPMGAAAIKKDPAIVSQPLLTTIVDVSSLLVYFVVAYFLIHSYKGFRGIRIKSVASFFAPHYN